MRPRMTQVRGVLKQRCHDAERSPLRQGRERGPATLHMQLGVSLLSKLGCEICTVKYYVECFLIGP